MQPEAIYVKTEAGVTEVRKRALKLPPRLRTVLILVDGTLNAAALQQAATSLGAPADSLEMLLQHGLIASSAAAPDAVTAADVEQTLAPAGTAALAGMTDPERFRAAQKFMNDSVVDALGLRAFFFTLKLEKCYTLDDLRALLPDFGKAVARGSEAEVAAVLEARARAMLR